MKFLFDFFPILLFFVAYKFYGIYTATGVAIAASFVAAVILPGTIWRRLNLAWAVFFATLGAANLYVVYHFDTDTWVNFKLFGMMGLTFAFVIAQAVYIARHAKPGNGES